MHAHRLRHTAATAMLRAGSPLAQVGQVLRHRSPLTTGRRGRVWVRRGQVRQDPGAPLVAELERLAQRARLDLAPPEAAAKDRYHSLGGILGQSHALTLVARGYTKREIAAALVISVETASVHVSHILR
jgi:ATP/maltotriose-dependent transcriptional regulator MalT